MSLALKFHLLKTSYGAKLFQVKIFLYLQLIYQFDIKQVVEDYFYKNKLNFTLSLGTVERQAAHFYKITVTEKDLQVICFCNTID